MGDAVVPPVLERFFDDGDEEVPLLFTPIEDTLDIVVSMLRGIDTRLVALEAKFAVVFDAPATEKRLRKARRPRKAMKLSCKNCRLARAGCSHGAPCTRGHQRTIPCVYQQGGVRKKR